MEFSRHFRPQRQDFVVATVTFIAGVLFATSASVFAEDEATSPRSLGDLIADENQRLTELSEQVDELRSDVAALEEALDIPLVTASDAQAIAVGLESVTGPGVRVVLDDAPASATSENPDDLVVHQQDVQAVVNALWAGGADAVSIQGQRVIATTAIRCVGNVLLLGGYTYSPPYTVEAIGPTGELVAALEGDQVIRVYQEYVDVFGLGWQVTEHSDLVLEAYHGPRTLSFAAAVEEGA